MIRGKAHSSYAGKVIQLMTSTDFITGQRQKESADTIAADGFFELMMQTEYIQPAFLSIGNVISQLYVQPDFVYGITIPELDETKNKNPDVELNVNIGVIGADSTELNALIFDYEEQYNKLFIVEDGRFLNKNSMIRRVDSLQRLCELRYQKIKNDYFKNYVRYSIASVNASLSRGEKYMMSQYISGKPVQYHHYEYMNFFNSFFKGYLADIASKRKGQSLYNIINVKADYENLLNFVRFEKDLKSDSIRELVIIREMWDYYFQSDFASDAIVQIVSQLNVKTKIQEHKNITSTMLSHFNKMQVGSPAPDFSAVTRDNKLTEFGAFKGRWVYLNFFSSKNIETVKELPKIAALKKKFGDKVVFVSVCLDDSISTYKKFLQSNPKYDWPIWYYKHVSFSKTAKEAYFITGTEGYFLINNFGYLAQSPAPSPSKGIEYKLNVIFKVKQRTTKTGIR